MGISGAGGCLHQCWKSSRKSKQISQNFAPRCQASITDCLPRWHLPVGLPIDRPVSFMQFCHLFFQLLGLAWGEPEVTKINAVILFWVIVSVLSLKCVGSQEGMSHKGAGQAARGDVLPQLKAQEVSGGTGRGKGGKHQLTV